MVHVARFAAFVIGLGGIVVSLAVASANVLGPASISKPAQSSGRGNGTVAFRIRVPHAPMSTQRSIRRMVRPQYVSVSTKSFAILTDGKGAVVADVNAATGYVVVYVHAAVGTHTFTVTAYDRPGALGNVLSTGVTAPVVVPAIGQGGVNLSLDGVVASVVLVLAQNHVTIGSPADIDLEVRAEDADGNTILPGTTFTQPLTLTSSDTVNAKLSQTTVTGLPANATAVRIAYSGAAISKIALSATGAGLHSVTPAVLVPLSRPVSGEQIIATGGIDANAAISTSNSHQLLTSFGTVPYEGYEGGGAAALDAASRLMYIGVLAFSPRFDIYQTSGTYALVDQFYPPFWMAGVAIDGAGKRLFATDLMSSTISIFSTAAGHASLGSVYSGLVGADLAVDPIAGRLYVAGCAPFCRVTGSGAGLQVFRSVPPYNVLTSLTTGAYGYPAVDPGAKRLYVVEYVPNYAYAYVDVFDTASLGRPVERIGPFTYPTGGLAIDLKARVLYVVVARNFSQWPKDVLAYGLDTQLSYLGAFTITSGNNILIAPYAP